MAYTVFGSPHVNSVIFSDQDYQKSLRILQTDLWQCTLMKRLLYQSEIVVQRFSFNVTTQNVKLYAPTQKIQCYGLGQEAWMISYQEVTIFMLVAHH